MNIDFAEMTSTRGTASCGRVLRHLKACFLVGIPPGPSVTWHTCWLRGWHPDRALPHRPSKVSQRGPELGGGQGITWRFCHVLQEEPNPVSSSRLGKVTYLWRPGKLYRNIFIFKCYYYLFFFVVRLYMNFNECHPFPPFSLASTYYPTSSFKLIWSSMKGEKCKGTAAAP